MSGLVSISGGLDTERLRRFVALENRKKELKAELEAVEAELTELDADLQPEFVEAGIQSVRCDGRTLYLHRQFWAGMVDGDRPRAVTALRTAGMDDYVFETFNTQSLSAYVRERVKSGQEDGQLVEDVYMLLPDSFRGAINVTEKINIRSRKAG